MIVNLVFLFHDQIKDVNFCSTVGDMAPEINLRFLKLAFDRSGAFIESSFRSIRPSSTRNDKLSVSLMSNCVDSSLSMYGRIRVNISKAF